MDDDSDSDCETSIGTGVVLTPSAMNSHSRASSISGGVGILTPTGIQEWSQINTSHRYTPASSVIEESALASCYDERTQRFQCNLCPRVFRKQHDFIQHLSSVAHAPKIFHCPIDILGTGSKKGGHHRTFKTLSGMAQHIEIGSCVGGKATLDMIVGIFEAKIKEATGNEVKLLS